jgi:hypothetical protein
MLYNEKLFQAVPANKIYVEELVQKKRMRSRKPCRSLRINIENFYYILFIYLLKKSLVNLIVLNCKGLIQPLNELCLNIYVFA